MIKRPSLFTYPGYPKHHCKRKYSRHKTESEKSTVAAAGNQCGPCAAVCAHCRPKGLQWILNGLKAIWVPKDHSEKGRTCFQIDVTSWFCFDFGRLHRKNVTATWSSLVKWHCRCKYSCKWSKRYRQSSYCDVRVVQSHFLYREKKINIIFL